MSAKLKVGIIGTGIIGKSHVRGYQSMPNDVEMVAVADINESEAQRVAQEHDIPHAFSDYRELLKIDEIDSVDVCLPNFLHAPVTIAALEAGKHVYCEKPMAKTGPEAVAMYEAAQRTGRKLSVQMATVFTRETRTAKHLIDASALGNLYYVKTSHYRRRGRPYVDGYATTHFVQREKAGGGTLLDTAIYNMARMVYLLDNPEIETVSASTYQELDMDEGRRQDSGYERRMRSLGYMGDGYESSQQHVVWGLLGRVDMIDTGAIGLTVARITEAMYQSAEQEQEIDLRQG